MIEILEILKFDTSNFFRKIVEIPTYLIYLYLIFLENIFKNIEKGSTNISIFLVSNRNKMEILSSIRLIFLDMNFTNSKAV
jgi:hypothetical protein